MTHIVKYILLVEHFLLESSYEIKIKIFTRFCVEVVDLTIEIVSDWFDNFYSRLSQRVGTVNQLDFGK